MKISAVPSVQNSMTVPTQRSPEIAEAPPVENSELPILDTNETKQPEATQPLSPQFAELAKRRRALQQKERALLEREKALASQNTGSDRIEIARLKSEPLRVLQEAGVTYDQLTEHLLATQEDVKYRELEAKLHALEEGMEKKLTERELQAERQVLAEMRREAETLIERDETFELVKATRSVPRVMELIERTYRESGEVLDVSEALGLVEEYLFNETKKLAGLNKIKSQFAPQNPVPQSQPQQLTGMRTLKNRDTAPIALSRKARALAAWNNYNK